MKNDIKLLEAKIENILLQLSLNSEFKEALETKDKKGLKDKYLSIKKDISKINDHFEIIEYYASLLFFEEAYISYAINLVSNKKENKSIYDSTDDKIDEKIASKENELETLVNYLKEEFPMVGNVLGERLANLKNEYNNNLKEGLEKSKHDSNLYLGMTNEIKLTLVALDSTKLFYLNNLEIFDELFLDKLKNMIDKNLQISKKCFDIIVNKLNKYREDPNFISLISKLNLLLNEYRSKCEHTLNTAPFEYINSKIEIIQNDYINRLNQFENISNNLIAEKEKIKHGQDLLNYLDNENLSDINYEKIFEIESYFVSNNLPTNDFYNKLYVIIEYELVNYGQSKIYENISSISKFAIEKIFINKVNKMMYDGEEKDNYISKYLKEGFNIKMLLDFISNVEELKQQTISKESLEYKIALSFSEGLAVVQKGEDLYGYIDKDGKEIIPCRYRYASSFKEGLAAVKNSEGLCGYIDKTGDIVIPFQYKDVSPFSEGMAAIKNRDGTYGYIDKAGKKVIPCQYKDIDDFRDGLAPVLNSEGLCGYIDTAGNEVIPCQYKKARCFSEGLGAVKNSKGLYGYVDKTGIKVIPFNYYGAGNFREGLGAVLNSEGLLWGYIDKNGKRVIPCQYKNVCNFSEGLTAVQNNEGLWGYIDKTGREVIPCQYKKALQFKEQVAIVCDENDNYYQLALKKINLNEFSEKIEYKRIIYRK